ncbi:MAG: hypothetical protein ACXW08_13645 [Solirubrobacteraceae bacterium]
MAQQQSSGISVQTLAISVAAAVAAAVVVPMVWERGTLVATAMTPVIVALVSEGLRHPAEKITTATSRVARRPGAPAGPEPFDPLPEEERGGPTHPFGLRERPPVRRHWRLAVVTGLVAFVLAATALTMSELVFGGAATRDSARTTIFGGGRDGEEATPTATPEVTPEATGEATATPEVTPTPTETPVPTATPGTPQAAPAPTVTP